MSSRHELIGIYHGLKRPQTCWENDDGTLTIIGTVEHEPGSFFDGITIDIKGTILPNQLVRGLTYRFFGRTKTHHTYGDQFVFESFVIETPAGEDAIVAYLTQCNGIGPVMARSIYKLYGDNSVQKLREHPEAVADEVPRFSLEKAVKASEFLKKSEKTERSKIDLMGLMKGRGFPKKVIDKLLDDYGAEAASTVGRNPYILMRYKGCGFMKTDEMYLQLRHNAARIKRQALCCWYAVAKQTGGDTWFRFVEVEQHLRQNISSAKIDIDRAMKLAVRARMLSETFHNGQRWVAEYNRDQQEQQIADLIDEARRESSELVSPVLWSHIADRLEAPVSDHQRANASIATSGFVGVLAGRPGTGKTFTVARIVKLLADEFGESHIAIAAPTGKAAVRVTAAMEAVGLGLRATTLHSLLGFRSTGFEYNREKPLPYQFVIVDESSMIDTAMFASLLEARDEGSHILFVGDPNQLAPVGHGAPLRDLIAANCPHGELTEIQRNSGRIVRACGEIIDNGRLTPSSKLDLADGENLLLIDRKTPEEQIDTLAAVLQKYEQMNLAGKPLCLDEKNEPVLIDPIWDIQIIVAVNNTSELARKTLNLKLQDLLNPDARRVTNNPFRVGDKSINTKNAEYKAVGKIESVLEIDNLPSEPTRHYVANGEQAEVLDVDTAKIVSRLSQPDRTIMIPRSAKSVDDDHPGTGSESEEATGSGCAWELGYAISGHKSQGSEWPIVIVMVDDYNGAKMVQSKQWIYTAVSRAKRLCIMIGQQKTINACCQRDALFQRKTFLKERILELRSRVVITKEILDLLLEGAC